MASYTRENLREKERQLIAGLLSEDVAEAKAYLALCRECPIDEQPNEKEQITQEEADRKAGIIDYLTGKDEGHEWNAPYIAGYLAAYCYERQKTAWAESIEATQALADKITAAKAGTGPEPTAEEIAKAEEKAKRARALRTLAADMPRRW